ncbi:hypothetical protein ACYUJ6_05730 [Clostridium sp. JNZ X4-2]
MNRIKELILRFLFSEDYTIYSEHEKIIEDLIKKNSEKIHERELFIESLEKDKKRLPQYFNKVIEIQNQE